MADCMTYGARVFSWYNREEVGKTVNEDWHVNKII